MHRWIIGLSLMALMGCQNLIGPRERRFDPVKVDPPFLSVEEQERLARDQLAVPEQSPEIGPRTDAGLPQIYGRR